MVNKDVIQRLNRWYSGDIHDCLDKLGIWGAIEGLHLYGKLPPSGKFCGPAITVQFIPNRAKITSRRYHKAIDDSAGSVLVIDTANAVGSCTGELMCTGAKVHGALGTIVNGTIRDLQEIQQIEYPVFAKGVLPVTAVGRMEDIATQVDIEIGGIRIQPGDIIFADLDGIVVIPQEAAPVVVDMADALGKLERNFKEEILNGKPLFDVFANF